MSYKILIKQEAELDLQDVYKLIQRFPYGIFYLIESETIYVIACFYVKRQPQQWRKRLN